MAGIKLRLDHAGIGAVLTGGRVTGMTNSAGHRVAANVSATADGEAVPVDVRSRRIYIKGAPRPAVNVTLKHPAGIRVEAKYGSLVRAASATGLEVSQW